VKRKDVMRHLAANRCVVLREGGNHTIMIHLITRQKAPVPRHSEINDFLARKIFLQLGVTLEIK